MSVEGGTDDVTLVTPTLAVKVSGACFVSASLWFVVALMTGVLILLALPILPIAGAAAITAFANRQRWARADGARSRLRAQGLDLGL
jgi:hypothetical protein